MITLKGITRYGEYAWMVMRDTAKVWIHGFHKQQASIFCNWILGRMVSKRCFQMIEKLLCRNLEESQIVWLQAGSCSACETKIRQGAENTYRWLQSNAPPWRADVKKIGSSFIQKVCYAGKHCCLVLAWRKYTMQKKRLLSRQILYYGYDSAPGF